MLESLSKSLGRKYERQEISAALVCARAQEIVKDKGQVVSIKKKVLKIKLSNPYESLEMRMREQELTKKINKKLGQDLIEKIRFC